jgi:hypothetical protein
MKSVIFAIPTKNKGGVFALANATMQLAMVWENSWAEAYLPRKARSSTADVIDSRATARRGPCDSGCPR